MVKEEYKVIIAGGGTGGHLFPGIAVAEEFKNRDMNTDILFMGTTMGIESKVLPREKYNVKFMKIEGFVRVSLKKKIRSIWRFLISFITTYSFIKKNRPDIMIGTGGYVSFLPVFISRLMSVPAIILEQNTLPGLSNRILSWFVNAICTTYEKSLSYFPKGKSFLTGNPVRERIVKGIKEAGIEMFSLKNNRFTIFVFGGSSGAKGINKAVVEALGYLLDMKGEIQFLHQTGEADYEYVRKSYMNYGYDGMVTPFIFQMPEAYAVADLVISRAGATTISEITAVGIPSILIPYPFAASSHQEINASRLSSIGAAVLLKESDINGDILSKKIIEIFSDKGLRKRMRRECISSGNTKAAKKIVDIAINLIKEKRIKSV